MHLLAQTVSAVYCPRVIIYLIKKYKLLKIIKTLIITFVIISTLFWRNTNQYHIINFRLAPV